MSMYFTTLSDDDLDVVTSDESLLEPNPEFALMFDDWRALYGYHSRSLRAVERLG